MSDNASARAAPKPNNAELYEYRRILHTLDHEQQLNLSAHLYSAFLIKKEKPLDYPTEAERNVQQHRVPHKFWTAWPTEDAPPPPFVDDSLPESEPGPVRLSQIKSAVHKSRTRTYPEFNETADPSAVLLNACEAFLQRTVYDRIHAETRANVKLEPRLDLEPRINDMWPESLIETVDKYLALPELDGETKIINKMKPGSIDYTRLHITGPAQDRIRALFGDRSRDERPDDGNADDDNVDDDNADDDNIDDEEMNDDDIDDEERFDDDIDDERFDRADSGDVDHDENLHNGIDEDVDVQNGAQNTDVQNGVQNRDENIDVEKNERQRRISKDDVPKQEITDNTSHDE